MNKKRHTKSPLPFQGQKRNWVKRLEELALQIPEGATVVDVFGGSGLCAHTIKSTRPDLRVIWNDYDNFKHRLDRIGQTNIFAHEIYSITSGYAKGAHISPGEDDHNRICSIFDRAEEEGADLQTLTQMVTFSADSTSKFNPKSKIYIRVRAVQYDATGYLDGVERVCASFDKLLQSIPEDAILILDPPYLSTDVGRYGNKQEGIYWGITEHLKLLALLRGKRYVYFTSNKSEVLELDTAIRECFSISSLGPHHTLERNVQLSGKGNVYKEYLITNLNVGDA